MIEFIFYSPQRNMSFDKRNNPDFDESTESPEKKKYKLWKENSSILVPLKTLQRWAKKRVKIRSNHTDIEFNINRQHDDKSLDNNYSPNDENLTSRLSSSDEYKPIYEENRKKIREFRGVKDCGEIIDDSSENDCEEIIEDNDENDWEDIIEDNDENINTNSNDTFSGNNSNNHNRHDDSNVNDNNNIADNHTKNNDATKLYLNAEVTVMESVHIVLKSYLNRKLTKIALQENLNILQKVLPKPNKMPKTIFTLFDYVRKISPPVKIIKHLYCKKCAFYTEENSVLRICTSCKSTEGTSYFYELDIIDQIKFLFEHRNLASKLQVLPHHSELISDITDGSEYIRVNSRKDRNQYDLTLILNTDGLSLVKSATTHCWPLMFTIAELPEYLRESFIIIVGLWYDTQRKPLMNTFLKPVCDKIIKSFEKGIQWTDKTTNETFTSMIKAPLFIADAPARAAIQNISYFNGKFGCNICQIKTQQCKGPKDKKKRRVFLFKEKTSCLRTSERMIEQGNKAFTEGKIHIKGVKGSTVISNLPFIDLGTCVIPEFMHSVLLGVVKQFINIWINKTGDWNIKKHLDNIDSFILNIHPPYFFNRMPRKLSDFKCFKASEFFNWLLYYSAPALLGFLPNKYLQHWFLLIVSIYNLLQKPIHMNDLNSTEILLRLFVRDVGELYGNHEYSYNLHQLTHLVLCVRRWGPLWSSSAFPFENYNGIIAKSLHGSKHLGEELMKNLKLAQGKHALKNKIHNDLNVSAGNIHKKNKYRLMNKIKTCNIRMNDLELQILNLNHLNLININIYSRMEIDRHIYTTEIYKQIKTNSYTIKLSTYEYEEMYGVIRYFLEIDNELYFIFKKFSIQQHRLLIHQESMTKLHFILPIVETDDYKLINVRNIINISHMIQVDNFICKCPHVLNKVT
ncbi:uncharacterized protein [Chelonus insularis]|uniref:uncharacterized protein isoform X1 n=2 Tax=Chelonus insularis TaxID=460826 RepID=UPI00158CC9AB|nr:uncharacterized protein LOC118070401 isoform X1 [Chelonus insularis]